MRAFSVLLALAAFTTSSFVTAHFVQTNGTHFVDPDTGNHIQHFGCPVHRGHGSHHFNHTIERLHKEHQQRKHAPHKAIGSRAPRDAVRNRQAPVVQTPIAVTAYFHVLSTAANAGTVTQAMADAQLAALNTAYNPYGIAFTLAGTTFTTDDAWAVAGTDADMAALKTALRNGTYSNLNLYFHTDLAGGNLGTCTLPSQVPPGAAPSLYASDGCNVNANTMPGGSMGGYNMGQTAVHETGHWLGLLHTFEGYSCAGDGDLIDDTPAEMQSTDGCPAKPAKDSCPTVTGVDPIHNYMDYSTDACYEAFTPDQIARIDSLWTQFRAGQ